MTRSIGRCTYGCTVDGNSNIWDMLLGTGVNDVSVNCSLALLALGVAVGLLVLSVVVLMLMTTLCVCRCTHK